MNKLSIRSNSDEKISANTKKPGKQHTPGFRDEALKLAGRISLAATARGPSLYEYQC